MTTSAQDSEWEALKQLCFLENGPSGDDVLQSDDPLALLLEIALASSEAPIVSIKDLARSIGMSFSTRVTEDELEGAAGRLVDKGIVTRAGPGGGALSIADDYRIRHRNRVTEVQELESGVFSSWRLQMRNQYPMLSDAGLDELEAGLRVLLTRVFVRHGVECASLLYAGSPDAEALYQRIESSLVNRLPKREGLVGRIRDVEAVRFFREATGMRLRFFGNLLRSSFIFHSIQIDPSSFHLVKGQLNGVLLFLDTNMLFALLGLNGEVKQRATQRLIKASKELGITVKVSRRSVNEFLYVIRDAGAELAKLPPLDREMARLPAELGEESLLKTYYDRYARSGISFELFESEYRVADGRLAEYGLEVGDESEDQIAGSSDLADLSSRIYEDCHATYEQIYGRELPLRVCEHDAFHVLLVQKRRGTVPTSFGDARAWFVTWDGKLPTFARIERHRLGDVPFCGPASVWLSFVMGLSLRTDDYEATAATMLWSSGLQSAIELPVQRLARVAAVFQAMRSRSTNPQFGVLVLLDARFLRAIRAASTEQFDATLPKLIDETAISVIEDYENETARSAAESRKVAEEAKRAAKEALNAQLAAEGKAGEEMEKRIAAEGRLSKVEAEIDSFRIQITRMRRLGNWTWKGMVSLLLIGVAAYAWWIRLDRSSHEGLALLLAAAVTLFAVVAILLMWLGRQRAWFILSAIAVVMTLLQFLVSFFGT